MRKSDHMLVGSADSYNKSPIRPPLSLPLISFPSIHPLARHS